MPILQLDIAADKRITKLDKKHHHIRTRYNETKNAFDENYRDPKLDFKKYKSREGIFKIRLLGKHDGRRLLLKPDSEHNVFYVFDVIEHDEQ